MAFVCLVAFILRLKADHGQSHMSQLMRTVLQDAILYFLVVTGFHIAMVFFTVFARVTRFNYIHRTAGSEIVAFQLSVRNFPPVVIMAYVFYHSD